MICSNAARSLAGDECSDHGRRDRGFTLIELLVVVVILGVLIAIAIPLYLNYRKGANDASAKSDLRNAVNVLEQCNGDNTTYPAEASAGTLLAVPSTGTVTSYTACTGQSIKVSSGTTMQYEAKETLAPFTAYIMTATNSNGSGKIYCYSSAAGGSVSSAATLTTYRAVC